MIVKLTTGTAVAGAGFGIFLTLFLIGGCGVIGVNKGIDAIKEHRVKVAQEKQEKFEHDKYLAQISKPSFLCWVNGREAKKFVDDPNSPSITASKYETEEHNFLTRLDPLEFDVVSSADGKYTISWKK